MSAFNPKTHIENILIDFSGTIQVPVDYGAFPFACTAMFAITYSTASIFGVK